MAVSLGLVFLAGLVSFLSPCVLSMVPIYLGMLGAQNAPVSETQKQHLLLLIPGLLFVLGFTLIFITLGFTTTILGNWLFFLKPWLARVGGLLIFIFGIHLTGLIRIPYLDFEWKPRQTFSSQNRLLNPLFMGIFFSAGWSPCIGPILGTILTSLATSKTTPAQGVFYLFLYSLGIALPFLLVALGLQPVVKYFVQKPILIRRIQQASGAFLALFGVLLMLGLISRLAQFSPVWLL
jgi:cytochrome c-type biogenesis protein